jgi:hypothetical protein
MEKDLQVFELRGKCALNFDHFSPTKIARMHTPYNRIYTASAKYIFTERLVKERFRR